MSRIIEILTLNLDLKKGAFLGNYLTKNSKTQCRKQRLYLLIINNKESPTFWRGFLQLTTYETQFSPNFWPLALSPSPSAGRTDEVVMRPQAPVFKFFLPFLLFWPVRDPTHPLQELRQARFPPPVRQAEPGCYRLHRAHRSRDNGGFLSPAPG